VPFRQAGLLIKERDNAGAEVVYRQALAQKKSPENWNALGVSLALQGNLPEAYDAFQHAVELAPDTIKYRENLLPA